MYPFRILVTALLCMLSLCAHAQPSEDLCREILRLNHWSERANDFAVEVTKDMPPSSRDIFLDEFSLRHIDDIYIAMFKRYFSEKEALTYMQFLRTSAGEKLASQTKGGPTPQFSAEERLTAQEFARSPVWDAFSRLIKQGIPELMFDMNARAQALLNRIERNERTG